MNRTRPRSQGRRAGWSPRFTLSIFAGEAPMFFKSLFAAAMLVGAVGGACAADISGAGATFPFPIYAKWADAYKKDTGNGLNYQSIGSGAGIKQIKAKTVTFGATDAPLEPAELEKAGLAQWP